MLKLPQRDGENCEERRNGDEESGDFPVNENVDENGAGDGDEHLDPTLAIDGENRYAGADMDLDVSVSGQSVKHTNESSEGGYGSNNLRWTGPKKCFMGIG